MSKAASFLLVALGLLLVSISARALHPRLDYRRYMQERAATFEETTAYLKGKVGAFAISNKLWTRPTDDEVQRFHMAKVAVEELRKENPSAEFSTDSPFTLMTDKEFAEFVGLSNGNSSSSNAHLLSEVAFEANSTSINSVNAVPGIQPHQAVHSKDCQFEVDWSQKGCITEIKSQGICSSCWAFATIAAVESARCVNGYALQSFSEQQLLACDKKNKGCGGGSIEVAMQHVNRFGVCLAQGTAAQQFTNGTKCSSCKAVSVTIKNIRRVAKRETDLVNAARQQPVITAVAGGNAAWKQYKGGILSTCDTTALDHAVLMYGFTSDAFRVKNSWGEHWGENGTIRLQRSSSAGSMGTCGLLSNIVYPEL